MSDEFIQKLLLEHSEVQSVEWQSDDVILISRKRYSSFYAAILKQKLVEAEHVERFLSSPVSVVANFPKIGKWTGPAIDQCEANGKAWGQWGVLLRAINTEAPETAENPEIAFSRQALRQHNRVQAVTFAFDHLLLIHHQNGTTLRVALLYEYDLTGVDLRRAWDNLGEFDVLLKTNPNGSIMPDAYEVSEALGTKVFGIKDTLGYLARGKF
ncbi:hypothetical protein [Sulfitobacter pontiacus]|uniref:hypothetical protein n=1 Tax=Sulfitobacter pontiacus TaxID=60137 RepID=UPI0030EF0882